MPCRIQNYVSDLNKLRETFHAELVAHATELSKALDDYSWQVQAALASFMENVATRGVELEAAAAAKARPVSWSSCNSRSAECR
jgi:hypothetical protein